MSEKTEGRFGGFEDPKANFTMLPNALIDALPLLKSGAEVKVVFYVLRHTWGYHQAERRMSLDELAHGRKAKGYKRNRNRLDGGTGLSENAIKAGIAKAIDHGFLVVVPDESPRGRGERIFSLAMKDGEFLKTHNRGGRRGDREAGQGDQGLIPWGQELIPTVSKVDTRSEKETSERNNRNSGAENRADHNFLPRKEEVTAEGESEGETPDLPSSAEETPIPPVAFHPPSPLERREGISDLAVELAEICRVDPKKSGNSWGAARKLTKEIGSAEDALSALREWARDKGNIGFAERSGPYAILSGVMHKHEQMQTESERVIE